MQLIQRKLWCYQTEPLSFNMTLRYADFKEISEVEQNYTLIQLESSIDEVDPKEARQFLETMFKDTNQDFYLRKRALQLGAYLVFLKKIKHEWLLALLVDVDEQENEFIVVAALQIGGQLMHISRDSIISWAQEHALGSSHEIRSEAFLLLGKRDFFEALSETSFVTFVGTIERARDYFAKSRAEIENRIDALIFYQISSFLLNLRTGRTQDLDGGYNEVTANLWTYIFFNTKTDNSIFFEDLCHPISVLHRLTIVQPDNWIDFKTELNKIYIEVQKLEIRGTTKNQLMTQRIDDYSLNLRENVIYELLGSKLKNDAARLYQLKDQCLLDTPAQLELLDDLLAAVTNEASKKKDLTDLTEIVARLHGAFPEVPLEQIQEKVKSVTTYDYGAICSLFEHYTRLYNGIKESEFETGTPQGDEIHGRIIEEINKKMADYPLDKALRFRLVLKDVVNYFIGSTRGRKQAFPFLFEADAVEKDLQNSMMRHFGISNRASSYIPEVTETADGGRVDILYKVDSYELPIELKRSQKTLSWDKIEQDYVSQAQTYAYTRDQLAFFLVLDTSPQERSKPPLNVRDLYKVLHLKSKHELDEHYPDYVICFIVPGNKIEPHERSKY